MFFEQITNIDTDIICIFRFLAKNGMIFNEISQKILDFLAKKVESG